MEEFTLLFMALSSITLLDQVDTITWRWTRDGKYTVTSAYECQFRGSFARFPSSKIWRCIVEPKAKFFLWLVLHDKILQILTTDSIIKINWPYNLTCSLYFCIEETTTHILTQCNFTEAVWNLIADRFHLPDYASFSIAHSPSDWDKIITAAGSKEDKGRNLGILTSF
jgi:hypothetical protein